jgi:hypothetical protein
MGGLLALDPTGTFFRFTKILQIVNKLYFININYGKRLEAFLDQSVEYKYEDPLVSRQAVGLHTASTAGAQTRQEECAHQLPQEQYCSGVTHLAVFSWRFKILFSFNSIDQDCAMFKDRDLLLPLCQQGPFDYIQPRLYRFHMVGAQDVAPLERPAHCRTTTGLQPVSWSFS